MLDRSKLLKELTKISDKLFIDTSQEYLLARKVWEEIAQDTTFAAKIKAVKSPWIVPGWHGMLNEAITVHAQQAPYAVVAVDGSQIYPDRHQGSACYLINIGSSRLAYGTQEKPVLFVSQPYLFFSHDEQLTLNGSVDEVNCLREEYELRAGLEQGLILQAAFGKHPYAVVFDGSLIFWHLESKDEAVKEKFLSTYLSIMHQFFVARIPLCSYISFPKSKELVNLIRVALCNFECEGCVAHKAVDRIVDAHVAGFFLQPGQRTTLFENRSLITAAYPDHLKTHFFYLHGGQEIVRVEIPAWVAYDAQLLESISALMLDQTHKGRGYPVCLAEAHEQAVIKGPDREFFYHVLQKAGREHKQRYAVSQKSLKKRGIGI